MRRWLFVLPLLVGSQAFAQQSVPTINFESVPNPLKLPTNMYFGEVSGVAVNSKGHVFALSRGNTSGPAYAAAATQLLEFDKDGKFIREIGKNLYAWSFAHTVKIDPSDNIWVTDKGSDMVIKFNPAGRVVMVFGRKQEASDEGTGPLKHVHPPLPPRNCSSSTRTESSSARSARTSTPGRSPTPSRSTPATISGSPTRARTW